MLNIEEWIILFLEQYRFEAMKLGPKDKQYLAPHVKEQLLSPPCEVEAVIFEDPFCLLFLFFLGPRVRDRRVSLHNSSWSRVHFLMGKLSLKYGTSHVDFEKLELNTTIRGLHKARGAMVHSEQSTIAPELADKAEEIFRLSIRKVFRLINKMSYDEIMDGIRSNILT